MALKLFNPFARYVVVKIDHVYYPGEWGDVETAKPIVPVHYTDDLKDAEQISAGLAEARDGRYEVCENAAWKALDKHLWALKATADGGDGLSIERQLCVAAEALHDMLEIPDYPEEKYCEKCEQKTGSQTETLCPDCKRYADSLGRKCASCGSTGCVPGKNLCRLCEDTLTAALNERARQQEYRARKVVNGAALERTDGPDTPTAKPEGSAVWAKTDK